MEKMTYLENSETYNRKNNSIYWLDTKVENVDINSFEVLNNNYAKDKNSIYHCSSKMFHADFKSFKVISDYYAQDKNALYQWFAENSLCRFKNI